MAWAHVSNFSILITYLLLGGFLFKALEWQNEADTRNILIAKYNNLTSNQDGCIDWNDVKDLVTLSLQAQKYGIREWGNLTTSYQWNYFGSLFFSLVLVSTVGYGNMAPSTDWGQRACVLYAFVGIPMFLNAVAQFSVEAKKFITRLEDRWAVKKNHRRAVAVLIMFGLWLVICACPVAVFKYRENWSFGEAIYFSFISLSTVGFGDYVAGTQTFYVSGYRLFLVLWMLIGLMYVALIINYVQGILGWFCEKISNRSRIDPMMTGNSGTMRSRSVGN